MPTDNKQLTVEKLAEIEARGQTASEWRGVGQFGKDIVALCATVRHLLEENQKLKAEINAAWLAIDRGWEIEPRSHFEREAPRNGFESPLAQAVHHMWKRKVKELNPLYVDESARLRVED